jgi:hypothetical protein
MTAYQSIPDMDTVWEAMDTRSEVGKEIDKSDARHGTEGGLVGRRLP